MLRGEPGVGKTALLAQLAGNATGMRVLQTQGIESESPLPFAALQRLLRPVLSHLDRIPEAQSAALGTAFGGGGTEVSTDRFVVFMAALSLLAEVAETTPVLCVVDDAHWLDAASAEALMFVARRLQADRVAIVFGAREGDVRRFEGAGLPDLELGGLPADAAAALLRDRAGGPVSDAVRDELMVRTGGNPLALVELPAALSGRQLAGAEQLPAQLPLTHGVERAFLDRARRLPADSQTLLLVAAADDSASISTVLQAAARLDVPAEALQAVEQSGLMRVSGGVLSLRHPLVRSAVYAAATTAERQQVHRALAETLGDGDIDRRTWHLSLATDAPDEALAAELDRVAERAARRSGHEAAGAAAERAAELSSLPEARARRLFSAATSAWLAGDTGRSRARADRAIRFADDPLLRSDIDRLRGRLEWNVGSLEVGQRIILDGAIAVAAADRVRALEMAMLATTLGTFITAPSAAGQSFVPVLAPDDPPRLHCFAALLEGHQHVQAGEMSAAAATLRRALDIGAEIDVDTDLMANLGIAAFHLGDDAAAERSYTQLLGWARNRGAVLGMVSSLARLPLAQVGAGRWEQARACAEEAVDLARGAGEASLSVFPLAWLALLAALRGDPSAVARIEDVEQVQAKHALGVLATPISDVVAWSRATVAGNEHDHDAALHHLGRLSVPLIQRLAAVDRVEAAARAGAADLVRTWAAELSSYGDAVGARWAHAAAEHGLALVSDGGAAEGHFTAALAWHERAGRPVDRARTSLAYGEFLRRARRRVDARAHLRSALEGFEDVGAAVWADRARQELRATGETARRRDVTTTDQLTPQELQTARLVSQGLSNREVAERLFVSPRTVEYHLSNAYQKLGVRSRGELMQLAIA